MVAQSGPLWSHLVVQLVLTSPKISYGSVRDKLKSFRDGQGRCYSQGGAGQDKAKNLGGRAGNVSYYAGHGKLRKSFDWNCYLDLGCLKFSQSNMLNIHNHDHHYDHNPCSVLSQCNAGPQCCFKGQGTPPGGASIPADNAYTHSL